MKKSQSLSKFQHNDVHFDGKHSESKGLKIDLQANNADKDKHSSRNRQLLRNQQKFQSKDSSNSTHMNQYQDIIQGATSQDETPTHKENCVKYKSATNFYPKGSSQVSRNSPTHLKKSSSSTSAQQPQKRREQIFMTHDADQLSHQIANEYHSKQQQFSVKNYQSQRRQESERRSKSKHQDDRITVMHDDGDNGNRNMHELQSYKKQPKIMKNFSQSENQGGSQSRAQALKDQIRQSQLQLSGTTSGSFGVQPNLRIKSQNTLQMLQMQQIQEEQLQMQSQRSSYGASDLSQREKGGAAIGHHINSKSQNGGFSTNQLKGQLPEKGSQISSSSSSILQNGYQDAYSQQALTRSTSGKAGIYQSYQSVRDILFQNSCRRSTERKNSGQDFKLKQLCFKNLKKYVKLKMKVRVFLSDEIKRLNLEFQRLQQINQALQRQNYEQQLQIENQKLQNEQLFMSPINQEGNFSIRVQRLTSSLRSIQRRFDQKSQLGFLLIFKQLRQKEKLLSRILKRGAFNAKLRTFLKWLSQSKNVNYLRPKSPASRTISMIMNKPPKHQNPIQNGNFQLNDLSTCPNSIGKTQISSGYLTKSKSQNKFPSNLCSQDNTQLIQENSSLNVVVPLKLTLNSRKNSQVSTKTVSNINTANVSSSHSSKRQCSKESDKSCVTTTTLSNHYASNTQSQNQTILTCNNLGSKKDHANANVMRSQQSSQERTLSQDRMSTQTNQLRESIKSQLGSLPTIDKVKGRLFDTKMLQKLQRIQILDKESSTKNLKLHHQDYLKVQLISQCKVSSPTAQQTFKQAIKFDTGIQSQKSARSSIGATQQQPPTIATGFHQSQNSQHSIQALLQKLNSNALIQNNHGSQAQGNLNSNNNTHQNLNFFNLPSSNISSSGFMMSHGETVNSYKTFEPTEIDFSATNFNINAHINNPSNFSISEYNMESMIFHMKNASHQKKGAMEKSGGLSLKQNEEQQIKGAQKNQPVEMIQRTQVNPRNQGNKESDPQADKVESGGHNKFKRVNSHTALEQDRRESTSKVKSSQYLSEREEQDRIGMLSDRESQFHNANRMDMGLKLRDKVFTPEFDHHQNLKQALKLTTQYTKDQDPNRKSKAKLYDSDDKENVDMNAFLQRKIQQVQIPESQKLQVQQIDFLSSDESSTFQFKEDRATNKGQVSMLSSDSSAQIIMSRRDYLKSLKKI